MFARPLSETDLYWIGYFRADGSICKKKGYAEFAQSYFHPVSEFAAYVGRKDKIKSGCRLSGYGFQVIHRVTSTEAGKRLRLLGVKSDLAPDIYRSRHFWRGMIDGDGSLPLVKSRSSSGTASGAKISLIASPTDIQAFQVFLQKNLGLQAYTYSSSGGMKSISLVGNQAKYLIDLLYLGSYSANMRKQSRAAKIHNLLYTTRSNSWRPPAERDEAEYSFAA